MEKRIFQLLADACKVLANPKRLEILHALEDREMTVTELVERVGAPKANISQHLALMRQVGVVGARRQGLNVYYSVANPKVNQACQLMEEVLYDQLDATQQVVKKRRSQVRRKALAAA